jgi:hypothetical protein
MRKYMKRCMVAVYVAALIVIMMSSFSLRCKDPDDFETIGDTLLFPPAPPALITPSDGYVFMADGWPVHVELELEWSAIDSAEFYEIERVVDTFPPSIVTSTLNRWSIYINDTYWLCDHYWRVRAACSQWKYYTEWSEQRHFEARWRPFGPTLQYPPHDTIFLVDSIYPEIELQWSVVQDEEYYEVSIYKDSLLYDQVIVGQNSFIASVDTGRYSWKIRAGSSKWQMWSYMSDEWNFELRYR